MKRMTLIAMLLAALTLLSGCNPTFMERQIFALCMSIDIDKQDKMNVSILVPMNGGGNDSGSAPQYATFSAVGSTLDDAMILLTNATPSPVNFSQLKLCVLGYELAATHDLLPLVKKLISIEDMRHTAVLSIALGNAGEVIKTQKSDFGMRMSIYLSTFFKQMKNDQTSPVTSLIDCYRDLTSGRQDPLLSICAVNPAILAELEKQKSGGGGDAGGGSGGGGGGGGAGGDTQAFSNSISWVGDILEEGQIAGSLSKIGNNPVEYLGSATVGNGRVSGLLSVEETQIALRTLQTCGMKLAIEGDNTQLQIWLNKDSESKYQLKPERIKKTVEKLQLLHCDALGFGSVAATMVYTNEEWQALKMERRYSKATLYVGVR